MDCELARERVSLRLDDELSAHEALLLDRHLAGCAACQRFADGVGTTTALLRAAPLEQSESLFSWRRVGSLPLSGRAAAVLASTAAAVLVAVSLVPSAGTGGAAGSLAEAALNPPADANPASSVRLGHRSFVVRSQDNGGVRRSLFGV